MNYDTQIRPMLEQTALPCLVDVSAPRSPIQCPKVSPCSCWGQLLAGGLVTLWSPGTLTVHALSQCLLFTCSAWFKIHCRLFMQLEARQTEVPTSEVWSPSVAYRHIVSKRTLRFKFSSSIITP